MRRETLIRALVLTALGLPALPAATASAAANLHCTARGVDVRQGGRLPFSVGCSSSYEYVPGIAVTRAPERGTLEYGPFQGADTNQGDTLYTGTYVAPPVSSGFTGPDSFDVEGSAGGETKTVTVPVVVHDPSFNRAPDCGAASSEPSYAYDGEPWEMSSTCPDPDADPLTYAIVTEAGHGHVTVSAEATGYRLRYLPDAGYRGPDSFSFRATDDRGADSPPRTISLTVQPPRPRCSSGSADIAFEGERALRLDCSDPSGTPLTFSADKPLHGRITGPDSDGNVTYRPDPGFRGTDELYFHAYNGTGYSGGERITLVVGNRAPTCQPANVTVPHGGSRTFALRCADPDGDPLSYSIRTHPRHGVVGNFYGIATYRPNPDYSGPDSFTFSASDGHQSSSPATATLAVADAPAVSTPPARPGAAALRTVLTRDIRAAARRLAGRSPRRLHTLRLRVHWLTAGSTCVRLTASSRALKVHGRTVTLARACAHRSGRGSRVLILRVPARLRRVLARAGRLRVKLRASTRPAGRKRLSAERSVVLRR